ncbi:hypothetical protein GCM10023219_03350 [Stakelama sediminis]|uniref:Uncharacterized protein n=1 Tax=Stakelama sediminis TaxID=463200 RepID=A0A840YZV8_9SPHN|nr:hypothetical protein [Stakelama sediminis]MBB5719034.1 hypothetical protein [Stakelama sediminis]
MHEGLWIAVGGCLFLAILAGLAEYRRARRRNLDRVGIISWPGVQMLALIAALVLTILALKN